MFTGKLKPDHVTVRRNGYQLTILQKEDQRDGVWWENTLSGASGTIKITSQTDLEVIEQFFAYLREFHGWTPGRVRSPDDLLR